MTAPFSAMNGSASSALTKEEFRRV
jgi:hypothetical protein